MKSTNFQCISRMNPARRLMKQNHGKTKKQIQGMRLRRGRNLRKRSCNVRQTDVHSHQTLEQLSGLS